MKNYKAISSPSWYTNGYGYYAFDYGEEIEIGVNLPNEGGILYKGPYLGSFTPNINKVDAETRKKIEDYFENCGIRY